MYINGPAINPAESKLLILSERCWLNFRGLYPFLLINELQYRWAVCLICYSFHVNKSMAFNIMQSDTTSPPTSSFNNNYNLWLSSLSPCDKIGLTKMGFITRLIRIWIFVAWPYVNYYYYILQFIFWSILSEWWCKMFGLLITSDMTQTAQPSVATSFYDLSVMWLLNLGSHVISLSLCTRGFHGSACSWHPVDYIMKVFLS